MDGGLRIAFTHSDIFIGISSCRGKIIPSRYEKFYQCCPVLHRAHAKGTLMLDYETEYRKIEKDSFRGEKENIWSHLSRLDICQKNLHVPIFGHKNFTH